MQKLYKFSVHFVKILTFILALILFAGSFLTTCYADNMETQQVLLRFDSPLWNLIELAGYGLLFAGCLYLLAKFGSKFRWGLLVFTLGVIILLGIVLILFGRTVPAADALSVYNAAAEWILGNTAVIHQTASYLSYYPQQIGLMAFLEVLLRIWNLTGLSVPAWHFIKFIYVCLLCVAVFFQYLSLRYLWPKHFDQIACCYLVIVCCNLPMIMYSSFVYGEIPSFAVLSLGMYLLLKLLNACGYTQSVTDNKVCPTKNITAEDISSENIALKNVVSENAAIDHSVYGKMLTSLGSLLFLTLSVMLRKNSLIPIIAVVLVLLFEAMRSDRKVKIRLGLLVMAVCLTITSAGILPLVQKCYEKKAGSTLSTGVTAMSYFAMGMQESSRGCGWYNGFNIDTYDAAGMDSAIANEISRQAISDRLEYFREHPGYAVNFYLRKHLSQWADGTYASRQATLATYGGRSEFFREVYEGRLSKSYIEWCNAWQNVLYLGVFVFCLRSFGKLTVRRKSAASSSDVSSEMASGFSETLSDSSETISGFSEAAPVSSPISASEQSSQNTDAAKLENSDRQRPEAQTLYTYIGLIAVLGGFLFHILWEANSRYIFSYSLLLMPYCAAGIREAVCAVAGHFRKTRH